MRIRSLMLVTAALPLRVLTAMLRAWPVLAIAAYFMLDTVPHLRWTYSYHDFGAMRVFSACSYIGPNGILPYSGGGNCPVVVMMNKHSGR